MERRCLVCHKQQTHPLHKMPPRRRSDYAFGVIWWGSRPAFDGYFYHAYDPGERRADDQRMKERP